MNKGHHKSQYTWYCGGVTSLACIFCTRDTGSHSINPCNNNLWLLQSSDPVPEITLCTHIKYTYIQIDGKLVCLPQDQSSHGVAVLQDFHPCPTLECHPSWFLSPSNAVCVPSHHIDELHLRISVGKHSHQDSADQALKLHQFNHTVQLCQFNHTVQLCQFNHTVQLYQFNHTVQLCQFNHTVHNHNQ